MARKEVVAGLHDYRADVGISSDAELLIPEAGIRTRTGDPVLFPSGVTVPLATGVSGTLPAANGGTGIASYAVGDIVYASGATALSALAGVATGNVLLSGGVTTAPAYGKVGLATHVSGTLPVANGGTGDTGTAWTTYTPVITSGGGAVADETIVSVGRYKTIGKLIDLYLHITITSKGTGSPVGALIASLPNGVGFKVQTITGPVVDITNSILGYGYAAAAATGVSLFQADGTTYWVDGYVVCGTLRFEIE